MANSINIKFNNKMNIIGRFNINNLILHLLNATWMARGIYNIYVIFVEIIGNLRNLVYTRIISSSSIIGT